MQWQGNVSDIWKKKWYCYYYVIRNINGHRSKIGKMLVEIKRIQNIDSYLSSHFKIFMLIKYWKYNREIKGRLFVR